MFPKKFGCRSLKIGKTRGDALKRHIMPFVLIKQRAVTRERRNARRAPNFKKGGTYRAPPNQHATQSAEKSGNNEKVCFFGMFF